MYGVKPEGNGERRKNVWFLLFSMCMVSHDYHMHSSATELQFYTSIFDLYVTVRHMLLNL